MPIDMRAVIAGLAGGAGTLGANINRRKDAREGEKRAEDRAMAMLLAKPTKENTQVVTGADENGPGIFLVDKDAGTKKRITDEAMAALTGQAGAPLLRKAGDPMPAERPAAPNVPTMPSDDTETHGATGDPMLPAGFPPPVQKPKLGLQPIPKEEKPPTTPRRMPRSVMVDGKPMEVTMDGVGNAYDLAGNKVTGRITPYEPPKAPALVTGVDEHGNPVRKVDAPGVQMPNPSSSGAAAFKVKSAELRATTRAIDAAMEALDKTPQATGGMMRKIGDIVPSAATAISMYDQNNHPELVPAQAMIANVGSLIIGERSGKAVTVSEFPRLAPFIPLRGDSPEVVRTKLRELKKQIALVVQEMGQTAPESPSASSDPEFDALMATIKKPSAKRPPA